MPPRQAPYVICYLCGRKYGTKSISIHEPHCLKKWREENLKLPKHLRRKHPPQKPDYDLLASGNFNDEIMNRMNEMSFKAAQEQLIPCVNCGRTFLPERLPVHQRSCTSDKPARQRPNTRSNTDSVSLQESKSNGKYIKSTSSKPARVSQNKAAECTSSDAQNIQCMLCNKNFTISKIQTHLLKCNELKRAPSNQTQSNENIGFSDKVERPRTRTIHKGPPKEPKNSIEQKKIDTTIQMKDHNYVDSDILSKEEQIQGSKFLQCNFCSRNFLTERLEKHEKICKKVSHKSRKTFDSSKQRLEGTESSPSKANISYRENKKPKSNWKQNHEDFIRSIRAAKKVQIHMKKGGKASDLPPPPPSLNPDYVHCQYCDRRFNPEVAERHIPKCATTINRPAPPKKKALDVYNQQNIHTVKGGAQAFHSNKPKKSKVVNRPKTSGTNQMNLQRRQSQTLRHSVHNFSQNGKGGYISPRYENRFQEYENEATKYENSKVKTLKKSTRGNMQHDPYKPKTFTGLDFKQRPSRGYSYNAMNYTGPNFFG